MNGIRFKGSMSASLHIVLCRQCCANLHETEKILIPHDVFRSQFSIDLNTKWGTLKSFAQQKSNYQTSAGAKTCCKKSLIIHKMFFSGWWKVWKRTCVKGVTWNNSNSKENVCQDTNVINKQPQSAFTVWVFKMTLKSILRAMAALLRNKKWFSVMSEGTKGKGLYESSLWI